MQVDILRAVWGVKIFAFVWQFLPMPIEMCQIVVCNSEGVLNKLYLLFQTIVLADKPAKQQKHE